MSDSDKGFFESEREYKSRIAHKANLVRVHADERRREKEDDEYRRNSGSSTPGLYERIAEKTALIGASVGGILGLVSGLTSGFQDHGVGGAILYGLFLGVLFLVMGGLLGIVIPALAYWAIGVGALWVVGTLFMQLWDLGKPTTPAAKSTAIQHDSIQALSTTSAPRMPQSFYDDYNDIYLKLPEQKAIALALDSNGTASWGWNYQSDNQTIANDRAITACNERRHKNGTKSDCKLYAVGGVLVWGAQERTPEDSISSNTITVATAKSIAENTCPKSLECGRGNLCCGSGEICVKEVCRTPLSIGEECEFSSQCQGTASCERGRCALWRDIAIERNTNINSSAAAERRTFNPSRVGTNAGSERYIDSSGCMREADGSYVVGYRSDCK